MKSALAIAILFSVRGPIILGPYAGGSVTSGLALSTSIEPTWDFNPAAMPSAIANLTTSLCINGTCYEPTVDCQGKDAGASSWACTGGTLGLVSSGTDPSIGQDTPLLSTTDKAVVLNNGKVYEASSNGVGDVGTDDVVVELLIKRVAGLTSDYVISKGDGATGYRIYTSSGSIVMAIDDGPDFLTNSQSGSLPDQAWAHVMIFLNRDQAAADGWRIYINGVVSGSGANPSTAAGSMSNADMFVVGALYDLSAKSNAGVALFRLWEGAAWLDTGAQAAVALERFSRLSGTWPAVAAGDDAPLTSSSRASIATLTKFVGGVASMFSVYNGWYRVGTTPAGVAALRREAAITNTFLQSRDLATSWTKLDVTDAIGGSVVTPFGITSTTAGLIGSLVGGDHGLTQAASTTTPEWTQSVFAKAGTHSWAYVSNNDIANATGYFNLSNCTKGTIGSAVRDSFITSLGNGWCEIAITYLGTNTSDVLQFSAADADGDKTTAGDLASVMVYFTDMQLEIWEHPTSRYPTTTATATRQADDIRYPDDGNATLAQGSVICSYVLPAHDYTSASVAPVLFSLESGTTDYAVLKWYDPGTATDVGQFTVASASSVVATINGSTDILDGTARTIAGSWAANDFDLYVDGASEGTPDNAGNAPTLGTSMRLGMSGGATGMSGDITRCRVFDSAGVTQ